MTIPNEWLPAIVTLLSLAGSVVAFFLARQEREAAKKLSTSQATDLTSQSYQRLVVSLEARIEVLEKRIDGLEQENQVLRRILRNNQLPPRQYGEGE